MRDTRGLAEREIAKGGKRVTEGKRGKGGKREKMKKKKRKGERRERGSRAIPCKRKKSRWFPSSKQLRVI